MAIGPSWRATGLIWGNVSMPRIVLQPMSGVPAGSAARRRVTDLLAGELCESVQCRVGGSLGPSQAGLTPGYLLGLFAAHLAIDNARALELPHAVGHPGHAQPGRDEIDDGLHLYRILRDLGRAAGRVVHTEDGVVQRRQDAPREDHQRLGQYGSQ